MSRAEVIHELAQLRRDVDGRLGRLLAALISDAGDDAERSRSSRLAKCEIESLADLEPEVRP